MKVCIDSKIVNTFDINNLLDLLARVKEEVRLFLLSVLIDFCGRNSTEFSVKKGTKSQNGFQQH